MQQSKYFFDDSANFNSDYTFTEDSMHKGTQDHIDRAKQHLKNVQKENENLMNQLNQLKQDPKMFIKQIRDQIIQKINQLKQDNNNIKKLLGNSKLPTYSSIKKKQVYNQNFMDQSSRKGSMRQSLRNSITARTVLSEIDSNVDKEIASTCQYQEQRAINPILKLKKPTSNQAAIKQKIQEQICFLLAKTEAFQGQIKNINKKQIKQSQKETKLTEKQQMQFRRIEEYKKKLLRLLNKLKSRQCASNQMIKAYKKLHQQTILKLKQATQTLQILQNRKIQENIDQKYQEVMELQQRLQIINAQLDQMDQSKWIESVFEELLIICKRLGIKVNKKQNIRQVIDQLCQNLIQHHLSSRKDNGMRLLMLKQYQQEQKKNNQKLLAAMKLKEQALGRKLIDIQMDSNK